MVEGPAAVGGRIFISYRRDDTAYPAGWLFDRLAARFGEDQVFKDVDSIELGDDFVEVITAAVASCDVLLALIGDRWLTLTDEDGKRRLDNPDDFVRLEIEAALARKVLVIPVLVNGARMPSAEELPQSLAPLTRRQALDLSPNRFNFDTGRLLEVLEKTLADLRVVAQPSAAPRKPRRIPKRAQVIGGVGAGAIALAVIPIVVFASGSHPRAAEAREGAVVFQDRFSSRSAGWDDAGKSRDGGHYKNGAYRLYSKWTKDHWSEHAYPRNSKSVFPAAPRDVRVNVVARGLAVRTDVGYGIVCRADGGGGSYYQFAIWADHMAIEKFIPRAPYYVQLGYANLDLGDVRAGGKNRMQAMCTTNGARRVHLALQVNGHAVASATDTERPLLSGTVGLVVATDKNGTVEAEFDDFVVTRA